VGAALADIERIPFFGLSFLGKVNWSVSSSAPRMTWSRMFLASAPRRTELRAFWLESSAILPSGTESSAEQFVTQGAISLSADVNTLASQVSVCLILHGELDYVTFAL
jgi:hypothetical protein